jgi:hypothetical protein
MIVRRTMPETPLEDFAGSLTYPLETLDFPSKVVPNRFAADFSKEGRRFHPLDP